MSTIFSFTALAAASRLPTPHLPSRVGLKRTAVGLVLLAALGFAGARAYHYWNAGRFQVSTDNAYVRADYTTVSPKISGYIAQVPVRDNEAVTGGQVLARIDDRDFRVALDQARAGVATAKAVIRNLDARITQQQSVIDQEKADIASAEAALSFASADNTRYDNLMKAGYGTVQRAQLAESALREKTAMLHKNQAGLVVAERKTDVLASERRKAVAQREHAEAVQRQAELNLSYTSIVAPVDGTVGARSLRVGQYVQAGTPLMAVVPLHAVYVVANFKETQLANVRAGQKVTIEIDTFPGKLLNGHVDSLSPASGLEFALLPSDNATGNFTKIVQRVPVKIALDDPAPTGLLRPGMSAEATIYTKPTN